MLLDAASATLLRMVLELEGGRGAGFWRERNAIVGLVCGLVVFGGAAVAFAGTDRADAALRETIVPGALLRFVTGFLVVMGVGRSQFTSLLLCGWFAGGAWGDHYNDNARLPQGVRLSEWF